MRQARRGGERESHREDVRKRGERRGRSEWRGRTKEPSETETERRECERLRLSAAMW